MVVAEGVTGVVGRRHGRRDRRGGRRRPVIRQLAAVEARLISELRAEHQDRPMARRPQRRLFIKRQESARRDARKSATDE